MPSPAHTAADARLGLPLSLFAGRPGTVATTAPRAMQQRDGTSLDDAVARTVAVLCELLDVGPDAIVVDGDRVEVALDPSSARLLAIRPSMAALGVAADAVRESTPRIRIERQVLDWPTFVHDVGADAAVWAVLASAGRAEPRPVSPSLTILAGRTDDNPLARLRRAHAASTRRGEQAHSSVSATTAPQDDGPAPSVAALAVALVLVERAAHDTTRTPRTRPLVRALLDVADATLTHLEVTPVTRTDLPLSEVARRVLADALDAAGVRAPVPF